MSNYKQKFGNKQSQTSFLNNLPPEIITRIIGNNKFPFKKHSNMKMVSKKIKAPLDKAVNDAILAMQKPPWNLETVKQMMETTSHTCFNITANNMRDFSIFVNAGGLPLLTQLTFDRSLQENAMTGFTLDSGALPALQILNLNSNRFGNEGMRALSTAIGKGALADPDWPEKILAGDEPIAFNPGMIKPHATLQNTLDWRAAN